MKTNLLFLMLIIFISCNNSTPEKIDYGANTDVGKYTEVNDIKVYYEIYGEGEPVLLVHGNGGSISNFENQIPELAKHFRVIAVDSRAQGKSSDSDKEISYALMASDMSELIDKLQLERVNVVGWSDGGNVGLEMALAYPEKVKKLITFGANYSWQDFYAEPDTVEMDPNAPLLEKTRPFVQQFMKDYAEIPQERLDKLSALMEKFPNLTKEQLGQIEAPVLVVAGDHDLIKAEHTLSLFQSLPHARLLIVPGASHMVVVEQPELVNNEINKFLSTPFYDINGYYFMGVE